MHSSAVLDPHQDRPRINEDLGDVAQMIHQEFDARLKPQVVNECLDRIAATFDDAKVRSFVPLLVQRYVSDELHGRLELSDPAA